MGKRPAGRKICGYFLIFFPRFTGIIQSSAPSNPTISDMTIKHYFHLRPGFILMPLILLPLLSAPGNTSARDSGQRNLQVQHVPPDLSLYVLQNFSVDTWCWSGRIDGLPLMIPYSANGFRSTNIQIISTILFIFIFLRIIAFYQILFYQAIRQNNKVKRFTLFIIQG